MDAADLRAAAADLWEAQHAHPFVRGIADGTLSTARWAHWVRQDHVFLVQYARLLALGVARAPDLPTMRRFAALTHEVLGTEMELHRRLAAGLGITQDELDREAAAPATQAYTDHLLAVASLQDFAVLAGALLPCMWAFAEIGQRLQSHGAPADPRCAAWIATYADPAFVELAGWCRTLVDEQLAQASPALASRVQHAFTTCSRHELAFWQMAWDLSSWEH